MSEPPAVLARLWISPGDDPDGTTTPADDLVDIKATLQDGSEWVATVCSFRHVDRLRARWAQTGECLGGRYLWAANLLLIDETSRASIEAMLVDLLATGEFTQALAQIPED